jgi:hypothetical protein
MTIDDGSYVERLNSILNHDLSIRSRDNYGALCNHCGWSILTRPELDFPDSTDNTIADSDPVVCMCGKIVECEFCGNQLNWVIEEDSSNFSQSARDGWPLGVDWTEFGRGESKFAYTMCINLHPQGPFPRPPQTANTWFNSILREDNESVVYDANYFNRLMSCFEVFHQAGLSIGAVQVGVYLAWHLSQEEFLQSAKIVINMVESNMKGNLSDEERVIYRLDIDALRTYVEYKISQENDDSVNIQDIRIEIRRLLDKFKMLSEAEQGQSGASQFIMKLMQLIDSNHSMSE